MKEAVDWGYVIVSASPEWTNNFGHAVLSMQMQFLTYPARAGERAGGQAVGCVGEAGGRAGGRAIRRYNRVVGRRARHS